MTTRPPHGGGSTAARGVANLGLLRPPLVFLTSLVSGAVMHLAMPLPFLPATLAVALGVPLVALAIALFSYSVAQFRAAGTPVPARKPTTVIVRTGPYRFSRNPIYLAFSVFQLGIAIWANSVWLAGYTRRGRGADPLCRHSERRAVPGTEIRCAVLGL